MNIRVHIQNGPIGEEPSEAIPGAGACVIFEGIVRPTEGDRPVSALLYEAYEQMAANEIERIGRSIIDRHGLIAMRIWHSTGLVPVGERSFRLTIWSAHRKEALAAADEFINLLKRDVPIWKKPVWADRNSHSS